MGHSDTAPPPQMPRDTLLRELEYRRKKQWDIFSWSSSLFTAILGGVAVLNARQSSLDLPTSMTLTAAVVILFIYSRWWIGYNLRAERDMKIELRMHDKKPPLFGYLATLCGLLAATLMGIWLPFLRSR